MHLQSKCTSVVTVTISLILLFLNFNTISTFALPNEVFGWGYNPDAELGIGNTNSPIYSPTKTLNLDNIVDLAGSVYSGIAAKNDGSVWLWGGNYDDEFGDGVARVFPPPTSIPFQTNVINNVKEVEGGELALSVLKNDGTVWSSSRYNPNLYNGTILTSAQAVFTQVSGLTNVTHIASGYSHVLALKSDGTVWAWGNNDSTGKLGNGTFIDGYTLTPFQVSGINNVTSISASYGTSIALKNDGTVWYWGFDGVNTVVATPTQVPSLSSVVQVKAGYRHLMARKSDGTVWSWGRNRAGQLGNGTYTDNSIPQQALGLTNAIDISGGFESSYAVTQAGKVYAWGGEGSSVGIGLGSNATSNIPQLNNYVSNASRVVAMEASAFAIYNNSESVCQPVGGSGTNSANTSAVTSSSVCISAGAISLYPGDSTPNNDICSNTDILTSIANPGSPVVQEGVTCNGNENAISLGSISTAPIRQNPSTIISDILFDDLRGQLLSNYTITAEVSNSIDNNNPSNTIILGFNPDGALATLDPGIVSSINIVNGGSGYNQPPAIAFSGGNGIGATATVANGVLTKIDVKSYGTGYTSRPTVVIVPTNGGSGATATTNIVEKDTNLNPETANPEANIFATLDPSVGSITKLKPSLVNSPVGFSTGSRKLITNFNTQHTLFYTTTPVTTGRYALDNTIFAIRTPSYLTNGDYRSVITQTIVVG